MRNPQKFAAPNPKPGRVLPERAVEFAPAESRLPSALVNGPRAWVLFVVLAVAIVPWLYLYDARAASNPDPFVLAQTAKETLAGKRLYSEAWMDKPPLGILVYAIPQLFVPRSMAAIAYFCGLCIVAGGGLCAYAFRRCPPASLACLMFVTLFPFSNWDYAWPSTEHFSNLFVMVALLCALAMQRTREFSLPECIAVGALVCLAFHVRQNTLLCGLLPLFTLLQAQGSPAKKLLGILSMAAGSLLGFALIAGLMLWMGDLRGYLWTTFAYPQSYASVGGEGVVVALLDLFWSGPMSPILGVFACLAATRKNRAFVLCLLVVGIVDCLLPRRHYGHYWVNSFPYVAVIIGLGIERIAKADFPAAWALPAGLAFALLPAVGFRTHADYQHPEYYRFLEIAETADKVAPPGATLLVDGPMRSESIQFASSLPAANRHWLMFQLQSPVIELLPQPWNEILAEYRAHPPGVIVAEERYLGFAMADPPPPDMPEYLLLLRALMRENPYRQVAAKHGYVIAVREGRSGTMNDER